MHPTHTAYTEAEAKAFEEGREARRNGLDYFQSPYMKAEGRDLYLICAFGAGWLEEDGAGLKSERLDALYGDPEGVSF